MPSRHTTHLLSVLSLPALLAGCTVGPDYSPPTLEAAPAWIGPADTGEVAQNRWWEDFHDPELNGLVEALLAGSPTLREARARLAEARASRDAVRGRASPQAQLTAGVNETVLSENGQIPVGNIPGFAREFGLFDAGFDASWEIDLWGARKREIEAANARLEQAEFTSDGIKLQLVAELARAYVDLRLAQQEVRLAAESLAARRTLADLIALRSRAGEASRIDESLARSDADNAEATLTQAQARAREAAIRVAVLVGSPLDEMLPRLEVQAPIPGAPASIGAGLPADLLRRRPDVRSAERALAAATSDVGVAVADLFPRIRLGLSVGQQARSVGDLFDTGSTRLQVGPSLSWPIFSGGSIRARVRAADARVDQAAAQYETSVIEALGDSEAAINRFDRAVAGLTTLERADQDDAQAYALSVQREAAGEDDRLALERAHLVYLASKQRLERARAGAADAAIGLHKALGGSWEGAGS